MEPTTGIEPVNLFLTKEALYLLSYVGTPGFHNLFRSAHPPDADRFSYRLSHIKLHSVIGRRRITIQPPPSGLVKFNM